MNKIGKLTVTLSIYSETHDFPTAMPAFFHFS